MRARAPAGGKTFGSTSRAQAPAACAAAAAHPRLAQRAAVCRVERRAWIPLRPYRRTGLWVLERVRWPPMQRSRQAQADASPRPLRERARGRASWVHPFPECMRRVGATWLHHGGAGGVAGNRGRTTTRQAEAKSPCGQPPLTWMLRCGRGCCGPHRLPMWPPRPQRRVLQPLHTPAKVLYGYG